MTEAKTCRFCDSILGEPFLDLGKTPLSNSYLTTQDLPKKEPSFPLRVFLCKHCFLVQLADVNSSEQIFNDDYAYYSSYSTSWLKHSKDYTALMLKRFGFDSSSLVVEVASNDGYLLQYFKEKNIPVLGIEPSGNCAQVAIEKGIPTWIKFFGVATANELVNQGKRADLLLGNNVLAHVPDLNDFVCGLKIALKPKGILTMEFPHIVKLFEGNQFDTIYHEHYSYFSFTVAERIFASHGLTLFDVEQLSTHGGSLRIYGRHAECHDYPVSERVYQLKEDEKNKGFESVERYERFSEQVDEVKAELLAFLKSAKKKGSRIAAYGAPAKGNTLLNFCKVTPEEILFTVDLSPHKQGRYLPGTHIPIDVPERIEKEKPDYLLILPWNLKDEISKQMSYIRKWDGKFAVSIPHVEVW